MFSITHTLTGPMTASWIWYAHPSWRIDHWWLWAVLSCAHTQKNLFEILLNQPDIRFYLPFSDWYGTKRTSVWFQINWKTINTIWFRVDLIRFLCVYSAAERLAYLSMLESQLRAPLKPLGSSQHCRVEEFRGSPNLVPHYYAVRCKAIEQGL